MALGQAFGLSDLTFKQIDANHTSSDVQFRKQLENIFAFLN